MFFYDIINFIHLFSLIKKNIYLIISLKNLKLIHLG